MDFVKMHGAGNDFVCLDRFFFPQEEDYGALARRFCNRRTGVGADGLLVILPARGAAVRMRIFNQDGSEAEMCGNGLRCLARFVYEAGYVGQESFSVETLAGMKEVYLESPHVRVDMGEPNWQAADIPVQCLKPQAVRETVRVSFAADSGAEREETYTFTAVSMGNPHCVIFCRDVATFPVERVGAALETAAIFPRRTNVEFVTVSDRESISVRVWERGVGETMACGTGACAAAAAAAREGHTDRRVLVRLTGGELLVDWREDNHIMMTGPARYVFRGEVLTMDNGQWTIDN
ncbi:MAG: diaminopimelate epimerase [Gracilibacteraceae bacterium]|jgi:diaminopimelate epimerase|nr:diaminopimelate epimerase [Gracilibacteraceae bacterium]